MDDRTRAKRRVRRMPRVVHPAEIGRLRMRTEPFAAVEPREESDGNA